MSWADANYYYSDQWVFFSFSFFLLPLLLIFRLWSYSVSLFVRDLAPLSCSSCGSVVFILSEPERGRSRTYHISLLVLSLSHLYLDRIQSVIQRQYPFYLSGEGRYRTSVSTTLLLSLAFNPNFPSQDDLHRSTVSRCGSRPSVSSKPGEPAAAATARILKYTAPIWRTI